MELTFASVDEATPGEKWRGLFGRHWQGYRRWFLSEGIDSRPTYSVVRRQLKAHMPEILPTYDRLCELAGGEDLTARMMGLYRPPAYLTGCSQVVWPGKDPLLIRNYDYAPALCEGVILRSAWNGRTVIAMLDCLWGALDGINDAGLAVSLTFGGRRVVGDGFGVPLILRYVLEFCDTTKQAEAALKRIPSHMAYNITAVDKTGRFITAYLAPDREPQVTQIPIAANHQGRIDWYNYARATATVQRERFLFFRLREEGMTPEKLIDCFFRSPLYTRAYANGFGTIYTSVYRPREGRASYLWPNGALEHSLSDFREGSHVQRFAEQAEAGSTFGY